MRVQSGLALASTIACRSVHDGPGQLPAVSAALRTVIVAVQVCAAAAQGGANVAYISASREVSRV